MTRPRLSAIFKIIAPLLLAIGAFSDWSWVGPWKPFLPSVPAASAATAFVQANATGGSLSTTLNIGTQGTNRVLVIFAITENASTSTLSGVTAAGNACVLVQRANNTNGIGFLVEQWYCDEDNLGASSGTSTITIAGTNLTAANWAVHAQLFTGAAQSGPTDFGADTTSISPSTTTSIINIDVPAGGIVVMGAGNGSSSVPTNSLTSPLVERTSADPASGDGQSSSGIESSAQTNKTYVLTWGAAPNRSAGALASWAAATPPNAPTLHDVPFDNERTSSTTPSFEFTGSDSDGPQSIVYQIQVDDTYAMTSAVVDCTSASCSTGSGTFTNTVSGGDTSPFNEDERIRFTPSTTLSNSTTYYWRVRASDDGGSNYGAWTSIRSITVVTGTSPSAWFQTTNEQFATGTLTGVGATSSAVVLTGGDAATFVRANASAGATSTSLDIGSAGTNRLVVVVASTEAASSTDIIAATVDGKACTQVREAYNVDSIGLRTEMWYCDEGDLGASNGTVTVRVSAATNLTPADWATHAMLFTGASQDGPYDTDIDQWSVSPLATATGTLDVIANGTVVAGVANGNGTGSIGSLTSPLAERSNADPSSADSITASGVETSAQVNKQYTATWSFTVNREAAVFASWSPLSATTGTLLSPEIDFDSVSGATSWDEASWSETETNGSISMQVYYTASTACDTLIPNGTLPGNGAGFSSGPIDLSALNTTTYNRICLRASLTYSGGSPSLNDWTVTWSLTAPGTPSASVYQDSNADGQVNRIRVTFDQTVTSCAYESGDWTINTAGTINVSAITAVSCTGSDANLDLTVTADADKTGGGTNPVISYANAGTADSIVTTGGAINSISSRTITDGASPVILSTSPVSAATGVGASDSISADFSETITIATCSFSSSPDPGGFGAITSAGNWSAGTNGQTNSRVTLSHTAYAGAATPTITISACTDGTNTLAAGPVSNPWSFTVAAGSSGGSTTNTGGSSRPAMSILQPTGGNTYVPGDVIEIQWQAMNGPFATVDVAYSIDGGATWTTSTKGAPASQNRVTWTVPSVRVERGFIRVSGYSSAGYLLAFDLTDAPFAVASNVIQGPAPTGSYDPLAEWAATPDINADKGLLPGVASGPCAFGALIKGSTAAVYFCANDGQRYVFPNEKMYFSWYTDFSSVKTISDVALAAIPVGGNVTYRPGTRLVKITTDPKVYAVSRGGVLRWIPSEAIAETLFGTNWNRQIDDVPDSFFVNYVVGKDISVEDAMTPTPAVPVSSVAAPTVAFMAPFEGVSLADAFTILATASDAGGVASVTFLLDSTVLATDTSVPYSAILDTTRYANGPYTLSAVATGMSGQSTTATRHILISNSSHGFGANPAPSVSFTEPASGATATGTIAITATASDDTTVASVQFLIGSTVIATDTSSPYSTTLDTNAYADGAATLTAIATDGQGSQGTATRSITIANGPPSVEFITPSASVGLTGVIHAQASSTDSDGVSSVKFYLDSSLIATDTSEPYVAVFTATSTSNGSHTLMAVSADATGHFSTTTRSITIGSSSTTPLSIVILGASTAEGKNLPEAGFSTTTSWVNRLLSVLGSERPGSTITNLAVSGFTTYQILPTGTNNGGNPAVSSTRNITTAVALNPDAIIVNMPSITHTNDEIMANLATVYTTATAAGIPIWFTTSQPQFGDTTGEVAQRVDLKTRIFSTYGSRAIDFQTPLGSTSDGSGLRDLILTYDDVHPTPLGHALLFEQVRAEDIPGIVAP